MAKSPGRFMPFVPLALDRYPVGGKQVARTPGVGVRGFSPIRTKTRRPQRRRSGLLARLLERAAVGNGGPLERASQGVFNARIHSS